MAVITNIKKHPQPVESLEDEAGCFAAAKVTCHGQVVGPAEGKSIKIVSVSCGLMSAGIRSSGGVVQGQDVQWHRVGIHGNGIIRQIQR